MPTRVFEVRGGWGGGGERGGAEECAPAIVQPRARGIQGKWRGCAALRSKPGLLRAPFSFLLFFLLFYTKLIAEQHPSPTASQIVEKFWRCGNCGKVRALSAPAAYICCIA